MAADLTENQVKWLEALESGEFEQGTGTLCTPGGKYCCLGVAQELMVREGLLNREIIGSVIRYSDPENYGDSEFFLLTKKAKTWLGVEHANPRLKEAWVETTDIYGDVCTTSMLAELNDKGKTFAEISALVREHGLI